MTDKDVLTMLTSEDSKRVADAVIESQDFNVKMRSVDQQLWKDKNEAEQESRLRLDHAYRWHVYGASILNMISTAAIVLLVLKVVTVL